MLFQRPLAPGAPSRPTARRRGVRFAAVASVAAALAALTGCGPTLGNVAVNQQAKPTSVWDNSDPAVLVDGGRTYLYGSSNNKRVPVREITSYSGSIGASQSDWGANPRSAMDTRPAWVNAGDPEIWAPMVRNMGGTYTMWFAARRANSPVAANDRCVGRAFATNPMGPFSPEASPFYCGRPAEAGSNPWGRGAIDPEVMLAADGRFYLIVALGRSEQSIGVVRLGLDGLPEGGLNGTPSYLAGSSFSWHGTTGFLENPSMIYDAASKTYLLFYSAQRWYTAQYVTGFARCSGPLGPCTLDSRGPFLKPGSGRTGPGGLTTFKDAQGKIRVAYASWTAGHENPTSNPTGAYSRQVTFDTLNITGTDPAGQTITLG